MENVNSTPEFGAPQVSHAPKTEKKRIYEPDGKDVLVLFLTWGIGTFLAALMLGPGLPGLGITIGVALWYGILSLLRGKKGFGSRAGFWLFLAVAALALTFSIWSNRWLRVWNLVFLLGLMGVQTVELFDLGSYVWSRPAMLAERGFLIFEGLFGALPAAVVTVGTKGKPCGKQGKMVLLGLGLSLPLVAVAATLLLQADGYFAYVVGDLIRRLREIFGDALIRLIIGLLLLPFLFGLCYTLRHGKKRKERELPTLTGMEPVVCAITLGVMDLLYGFFLVVQSAALFGGAEYLSRVPGLSYAEYARSGFFQLVFVAALNLALVLAACQFSKQEGGAWRAVQLLCSLMIAMSAVILLSAAYRMTLYVQVYGLSFKRFLTYWGMVMLVIFLLAAAMKVWKKEFGFFKVLLTVSIVGWLALNACNVDRVVAEYNVALYQHQETALLDMDYMVYELSYDALDALEGVTFKRPVQNDRMKYAILDRRARAGEEASHWQTWSLSAYLASK